MTMRSRTWHPHPLHRPGWLLVGLLQAALGALLVVDGVTGSIPPVRSSADVAVAYLVVVAASTLVYAPSGRRRHAGRAWAAGSAIGVAFGLALVPASPAAGLTAGAPLLALGLALVIVSERRRRRIVLALENDRLVLFVRRYRLEHTLPFEAVKEVTAARGLLGKVLGFGDFTARVRKGTMADNLTKPLVGEAAPADAAIGNGWDEEERFHVVAAHPYKRLRRELENRILLARLPPQERAEEELATRLQEDLEGLKA